MRYASIAVSLAAMMLSAGFVAAEDNVLNVLTLTPPDSPVAKIQDDVIAAFEKDTGATVKLTTSTDETPEVFETSVLGNKEADVVFVNLNEGSLDWVKNGIAVPVDAYLDQWNLRSRIVPRCAHPVDLGRWQDQWFPL